MSRLSPSLFLVFPLFLSLACPAQDFPALDRQTPAPGKTPGTQSWIVLLKSRPFDLSSFREAVLQREPEWEIQRIVAGLEEKARTHQAPLTALVEEAGGRVTAHFWLVNAMAVEVPPSALPLLRDHPMVERLVPDTYRGPGGAPILKSTNTQNHVVDPLQAKGIKGKGVVLAVADTGFDIQDKSGSPPYRPNPTFYVNGDPKNQTGGGLKGSRLVRVLQMGIQPVDAIAIHGTSVTAIAAGEKWDKTRTSDRGHAPAASIAAYAWAERPGGFTLLSTMVKTWQKVASDRAKYKILVANNSFMGSAPSYWVEQQAMDSLVLNADIFVAAMCGNFGVSTHYSNGATNILAVGAVEPDTRKVADYSSRGPLWADGRYYPDIVANGSSIVTPKADGGTRTSNGTSNSTPQVSGAALLYRFLKPSATALETRAVLLATAQDISAANTVPPYNTRNAYGLGYLRDDRAAAVAQGKMGAILSANITKTQTKLTFTMSVKPGNRYAAVLSWNRYTLNKLNSQSNLDLEVRVGPLVIASSRTPRNVNEKVVFLAPGSGKVNLVVTAKTLEKSPLPFVLVLVPETPPYLPGSASAYGKGCPGTFGGGAVPILVSESIHIIGSPYRLNIKKANLFAPAFLLLGRSNKKWGKYTLPLNLAFLGAPKCDLLASVLLVKPFFFGWVSVQVPENPAFLGISLYHQGLVLDKGANPAGLAFSNGLRVVFGGQ